MWPRFRPGRRIAVSAHALPTVGDDVLVKLKEAATEVAVVRALIGELTATADGGIELRQFNPDVTFRVAAEEISAIEKVVGELI
jgi:hypothetical protein